MGETDPSPSRRGVRNECRFFLKLLYGLQRWWVSDFRRPAVREGGGPPLKEWPMGGGDRGYLRRQCRSTACWHRSHWAAVKRHSAASRCRRRAARAACQRRHPSRRTRRSMSARPGPGMGTRGAHGAAQRPQVEQTTNTHKFMQQDPAMQKKMFKNVKLQTECKFP